MPGKPSEAPFSVKVWEPNFPFKPRRWPHFYGWMIVLIATLGMVFSIPGQTMGFSVFTEILMQELGLTRVQLSTAYCMGHRSERANASQFRQTFRSSWSPTNGRFGSNGYRTHPPLP